MSDLLTMLSSENRSVAVNSKRIKVTSETGEVLFEKTGDDRDALIAAAAKAILNVDVEVQTEQEELPPAAPPAEPISKAGAAIVGNAGVHAEEQETLQEAAAKLKI